MPKAETAFRTIGEVSEALDVPQHVLRFWETRFPQIAPLKSGGGRRYYRPDDIALLAAVRKLLYVDGYTIKGVQRVLRSEGVQALRSGVSAGPSRRDDGWPRTDATPSDAVPATMPPAAVADPATHSLRDRLAALADTLDACARRLADARARALAPR